MKLTRRGRIAFLVFLFVVGTVNIGEPADASHRRCGQIRVKSVRANKRFIRCVARHVGVPGGPDVAIDIARCETGFNWRFLTEDYGGTFSGSREFWPPRVKTYLQPRYAKKILAKPYDGIRNAKANARVHLRLVDGAGTWRNHFPSCSRQVGAP